MLFNRKQLKCSKGQSLAEYALVLFLVIMACLFAMQTLGGTLNRFFTDAGNAIQNSNG